MLWQCTGSLQGKMALFNIISYMYEVFYSGCVEMCSSCKLFCGEKTTQSLLSTVITWEVVCPTERQQHHQQPVTACVCLYWQEVEV